MANVISARLSDLYRNYTGLSREAKLMLTRAALFGLGAGIWTVIFNLYLLSLDFDAEFIAKMTSVKWWANGLMVLPAGIISDLYGRRKIFLVAISIAVVMYTFKLGVTDPKTLLLLSGLGGAAESFQIVVGGPFLMEHSKKEERVYLFSLFTFIILMASMLGSVLGGLLSGLGGLLLSRAPGDAASLRFALAVAIPLMFLSLVPIYLIKENWQRQKLSAWFKGIKSWSILGMLAITTGLAGLAMGFTFPFYNVYFNYLGASPPVIGAIFAAGSLAGALGTALAPLVESKLGKVKTITAARLVSVPFLMGIVLFPLLPISALFYLGRRASMTLGFPVRALFRMEIVGEQERGATTGLVHAMAQFPIGISAWMAGSMMARDDWVTPYAWASILLIGSAAVFFFYFGPLEKKLNRLP